LEQIVSFVRRRNTLKMTGIKRLVLLRQRGHRSVSNIDKISIIQVLTLCLTHIPTSIDGFRDHFILNKRGCNFSTGMSILSFTLGLVNVLEHAIFTNRNRLELAFDV